MILAALLLGTVACADRAACPSRAEVEQAFRDQQVALEFRFNRDANPPGAETLTMISMLRIVRITRVRCSRPLGSARSVICHARVQRYRRRGADEAVRLVRGPKGWIFAEEDAG